MANIANVTFLFTDVEGSTRLWQSHPEELPQQLARHNELLRKEIDRNGGRVFKEVGDGFCAKFEAVMEAAVAATTIQLALAGDDWKPKFRDDQFRVRMAIHWGYAEQIGDDYSGLALAETQRLMSAGHGGQILLSKDAAIELSRKPTYRESLRDLGTHRLRDLQQTLQIFQLDHGGNDGQFPPLRTLDGYANNLPRQLTRFIGRDKEVLEIKGLLKDHRLVTVTGAGGAGKTRLAIQVAAEVVHHYASGAFLIDLAGLTNPDLIATAIANALKIPDKSELSSIDSLIAGINEKSYLIVLDNCEHLIDGCASIVSTLLECCPMLHILATSRERLRITGEMVRPLSSLDVPPDSADLNIDDLCKFESVQLLVERIVAIKRDFQLTIANTSAVISICRCLDGLPLALELAAALCSALSINVIAARLANDLLGVMSHGSRTAPSRQQTLRALIDWSYDILRPDERILFSELSVFSGGWTLDAAEAVCGESLVAYDVLTCMTALVEKSLVVMDSDSEPPRYRLLETLRVYAQKKLNAGCEANCERVQKRHVDYFQEFGAQAKQHLQGGQQGEWMDRIGSDHDNIRAALNFGVEFNLTGALELASDVYRFWYERGFHREWRGWFDRALRRASKHSRCYKMASVNGGWQPRLVSWRFGLS